LPASNYEFLMEQAERLQKIIAGAGIASRRKAELLIQEGRVTVNGQVVTQLGAKADPKRDHIKVDGKLLHATSRKTYILLNKPRQVISSVSDPQGRVKVTDLVEKKAKIYPVGRLDYNTEGLILLTNDGEFSKIASSAGNHLAKVYQVKVRSKAEEFELARLRQGIRLKGGEKLAPCRIEAMSEGSNSWYEVTLTQGKNRQVREMFESIRHPVLKLRRIRIGFLTDKGLAVGQYRHLTPKEVARILRPKPKVTKSRGRVRGDSVEIAPESPVDNN
jgi:23S rRNA pseudouridine2605 synthase